MSAKRVLVVEDDTVLRELLEFLLQREGYETLVVSDGEQAQQVIEAEPLDLVLMDLQLSIVSGRELIIWLRERDETESLPVLVLTSLQSDDDISEALDLGANDYMIKPFQPKELQARIRKLLKPAKGARL